MGQKVNPIGFRVGHVLPWKSRWFSERKDFKELLIEDLRIRKALMDKLKLAGITDVEIERLHKSIIIRLTVSRPGVVIGRGGTGIEEVKRFVVGLIQKERKSMPKDLKIDLQVSEIKNPETSAYLVATRIIGELERRMPQRRVVTRAMERVMSSGAKGVKVLLAGRINGAEISRKELYHIGSIPAQTLRANIDYAEIPASLKRGYVGVKVWILKDKE